MRTVAAIDFAADSTTSRGSPSTITRNTGSVPEGRSSTLPRPLSERSARDLGVGDGLVLLPVEAFRHFHVQQHLRIHHEVGGELAERLARFAHRA